MFFSLFKKQSKFHLVEVSREKPSPCNDYVDVIIYDMIVNNRVVGVCDLRLGFNENIYYAGNIGYHVYERYRGNGYAYKACIELLKIAKELKMDKLYITCSPENIASKKTIEKLDVKLLEIVQVPTSHWLYRRNEKVKCIYEINLGENDGKQVEETTD